MSTCRVAALRCAGRLNLANGIYISRNLGAFSICMCAAATATLLLLRHTGTWAILTGLRLHAGAAGVPDSGFCPARPAPGRAGPMLLPTLCKVAILQHATRNTGTGEHAAIGWRVGMKVFDRR